jgi:hypothetical protein
MLALQFATATANLASQNAFLFMAHRFSDLISCRPETGHLTSRAGPISRECALGRGRRRLRPKARGESARNPGTSPQNGPTTLQKQRVSESVRAGNGPWPVHRNARGGFWPAGKFS